MFWKLIQLVGYFAGIFVLILCVGITDVIALQWNEASIDKEHRLTGWYVVTNIWSSLLGFYCQAVLPWSVGLKGRMRHWIQISLWFWCVIWDQSMRVWWYFHERAARAAGHEPSRQQMLLWAIGNDLNSLILVPFVFIHLPRHCPSARAHGVRQESNVEGNRTPPPRDTHDLLVGCCVIMAVALIVLDLPVYQHIRDSWSGHLGRLFICPVLYLMPRFRRPSVIACVYGYVLLQNLTMDWSWATIRIIQGQEDESSPLGPMSVVVYSMIWQALYTTAGNLIVLSGLPRRGATILLLMFFFWSEYLLLMLLVDTGQFNFNFCAALGLKLIRKPMIFHPGMAKSLRHFYKYKLGIRWLVPNFPREKEMDDMLLLSHVCSIMSTTCAALLLMAFRFLPWKADSKWSARQYKMPLILIAITLASELVILVFTILGARLARVLEALDTQPTHDVGYSRDQTIASLPQGLAAGNSPLPGRGRGGGVEGSSAASRGSSDGACGGGGDGGGGGVGSAGVSSALPSNMDTGGVSAAAGSLSSCTCHPIVEGCQHSDCLARSNTRKIVTASVSSSSSNSSTSTTAATNNVNLGNISKNINSISTHNLNSCNNNNNLSSSSITPNIDSRPSRTFGSSLSTNDMVLPSWVREPSRTSQPMLRSSFSVRVGRLQACLPRLLDWSPDLDWWVRFMHKTFFLWAACLGLCVERSNEKLLHSASDFLPPKKATMGAIDQPLGADIGIGFVWETVSWAATSLTR